MGWRAVRWIGVAVALGGVGVASREASAFSMAEQVATTGVANTLAGTGSRSVAGTLGSVKNKVSSSAPKLTSLRQPTGPGAGAPRRTGRSAGKTGWGDAKGWARRGKGGGSGKGGGWVDSGGWPKADPWSERSSKAWAQSGGGSWARPGNRG